LSFHVVHEVFDCFSLLFIHAVKFPQATGIVKKAPVDEVGYCGAPDDGDGLPVQGGVFPAQDALEVLVQRLKTPLFIHAVKFPQAAGIVPEKGQFAPLVPHQRVLPQTMLVFGKLTLKKSAVIVAPHGSLLMRSQIPSRLLTLCV
jgi:hypothetical protein